MSWTNNRTGKKISIAIALLLIMNLLTFYIHAKPGYAAESVNLNLNVKAAILMEASTGQILYEYNADEALPPASMSKMMSEYIIMEEIKAGRIKWEDEVVTSQYAADVIGSGQLLGVGEKYTVRDLFGAMSIYSANDATVALAERVATTEENFVNMMNETAKRLGMTKSHFINSTGLNREDLGNYQPNIQGETMMSARDAAILAYHIINEHAEVLEFSSIPSQKFRETDKDPMINWNWMLEGNKDITNFRRYAYEGLDGLKTGHTDEAGYCFTGTAERDGMRLISVVMAAPSMPQRFDETRKLMDYGFTNFEKKLVLPANSEIENLQTVSLKKGVKTEVPIATQGDIEMIVKKGEEPKLQTEPLLDETRLVAPLKKGDVVGTLKITYDNTVKETNIVAMEDVNKGSWIRLLFRAIKNFFGDIFSSF